MENEKTFWDSYEIVQVIKKSETQAYQIAKAVKGNNVFVDIRKMFKKRDEKDWKFTKKGVSIPLEIKNELAQVLVSLEF